MHTKDLQRLIDSSLLDSIQVEETIVISDRSYLDLKGLEVVSSADPVFTIQGRHWMIQAGKVKSTSGVIFDCISSQSGMVLNTFFTGSLRAKPLFQCLDGNSCYDTHFIGGEWQKPQGMLSPIVSVEVDGPYFNNNSWSRCRFQTNGMPESPCVKLTCTKKNNWIYGNSFQQINFEIPNGGAIHLHSCFGHTIQDVQMFDADLFGTITNHLIYLTRSSATSLRSTQTRIHGYFRLSGVLDEGVYDIFAPSSDHTFDTLDLNSIGGIQGAQTRINVSKSTMLMNRSIQSQFVIG